VKCPVCRESSLVMTERQGVEIDYCPECRGVWLDRGELDKIIERAAPASPGHESPRPESRPSAEQDRGMREQREVRDLDDRDPRRKKKRGGFLGDLFEFD
jgi:Zn-finger nucleic acid-binding protein